MSGSLLFQSKQFLQDNFPIKLLIRDECNYTNYEHAHDYPQINYVLEGACRHFVAGKEAVVTRGELFSIPPYIPHRIRQMESCPFKLVQLDFMPSVLEQELRGISEVIFNSRLLVKFHISSQSQWVMEQLCDNLLRELDERPFLYQYAVQADLLKMFITISREVNDYTEGEREGGGSYMRAVRRVIRHMEQHIGVPVSLKEASSLVSISPNYFSTLFRKVTGMTFKQYANELRLRKAGELLRSGLTAEETMHRTGFMHAGHFFKLFKQAYGMTPQEYKKADNPEQ